MPTLLELQVATYRSLVTGDDRVAASFIDGTGLPQTARLNIYRNTFIGTLTTALRLSFPAIHQLVGSAFFESAARIFIEAQPPQSADLDAYGRLFPAFLAGFSPAATLTYLSDVARLEWAVNRALHADDAEAIAISRLAMIADNEQERVCFVPHPSIGLVRADYPVDMIWRAVLARNDADMAAIDLDAGPVWLLVQSLSVGVEVTRMNEAEWHFAQALCASRPLSEAMKIAVAFHPETSLAEHFKMGRFMDFKLNDF